MNRFFFRVSCMTIAALLVFNISFAPDASSRLNIDEVLDIESMRPTGERHKAMVPDTLDLVDQMEYSVNILTNSPCQYDSRSDQNYKHWGCRCHTSLGTSTTYCWRLGNGGCNKRRQG